MVLSLSVCVRVCLLLALIESWKLEELQDIGVSISTFASCIILSILFGAQNICLLFMHFFFLNRLCWFIENDE